jgi:hypothetical protein
MTLIHTLDHNMFIHWVITYTKVPHITDMTLIHTLDHNMFIHWVITQVYVLRSGLLYEGP